jgi:hypothetical protein
MVFQAPAANKINTAYIAYKSLQKISVYAITFAVIQALK